MAVQVTYWQAADGQPFKTQAEALAWELRRSVMDAARAVGAVTVDSKGDLDVVTISGMVQTFAAEVVASAAVLTGVMTPVPAPDPVVVAGG